MNVFTLIPARSGSKSLPDKNIKLFNNKPLLAYSIEYSLSCPLIKRTIVSTDSEIYADIARNFGAEVPFLRPHELSGDTIRDFAVVEHALLQAEKIYNEIFDYIVLLRPTSPLRPANLIEKGFELIKKYPNASSVRSVAVSEEHPYRQWVYKGTFMTGYESNVHESYNIPRQELPVVLFQTGDIEIVKRDTIINGSVSGDSILPLLIEHEQISDIDTVEDWQNLQNKVNGL